MTQPSFHRSLQASLLEPFRREIERCVRCGACRAVCPPFLQERGESFSARGRMALIKAVLDGKLRVSTLFRDRLTTCTGCLACEASCPSGVPVTEIIQAAKEQAIAEAGTGLIDRILAGVANHPAAFRATAWLAPAMLHYSRGYKPRIRNAESPIVSGQVSMRNEAKTASTGTVAFYPGCAVNYLQQDIGRATVSVLAMLGWKVLIPEGLKCCGKPLLSLGDRAAAQELAEHNSAVLAGAGADAIVTVCASCGLTFKRDYPKLLRPGKKPPVVLDIHEFLAGPFSRAESGPVRRRVTWHDPCHLSRGQGLSSTARAVIRSIPGIELVEMNDADRCCGFGGLMRVTHHDLSDSIAKEKAGNIIATRASAVVTGCPGCCMQISHALKRAGSDIEVLHTVQLIEKAMSNAESPIKSGRVSLRNGELEKTGQTA